VSNNREDYLSNPLVSSCRSYLELTWSDPTISLVFDRRESVPLYLGVLTSTARHNSD